VKTNRIKAVIGLALGLFTAVVGAVSGNDLVLIAGLGVIAIEGWDLV